MKFEIERFSVSLALASCQSWLGAGHSRVLLGVLGLLATFTLAAQDDRLPSPDVARQRGHLLAVEVRQQQPATGFTNTGVFRMRNERGRRVELPVEIRSWLEGESWMVEYRTRIEGGELDVLRVAFNRENPPAYERWWELDDGSERDRKVLNSGETAIPYAGTDVWVCDLGLEFLHWEDQRWVRRERSNGRWCDALDSFADRSGSTDGSRSGYVSVRSWIDAEYRALLRAEGYNDQRILIKEFSVGSFRKVTDASGEESWMLKDIRIRDVRRDRRTELIYDLPD